MRGIVSFVYSLILDPMRRRDIKFDKQANFLLHASGGMANLFQGKRFFA
jgi:hypothetical protein